MEIRSRISYSTIQGFHTIGPARQGGLFVDEHRAAGRGGADPRNPTGGRGFSRSTLGPYEVWSGCSLDLRLGCELRDRTLAWPGSVWKGSPNI